MREAASLLFAMGRGADARALLAAELDRDDPRALLQLAWLRLAAGDHGLAKEARDAFLERAPALAKETGRLDAALAKEQR